MLEWLKEILGETWTEDIDEKVRQKIGKEFVSKKDFNEKVKKLGEYEKTIQEQTTELDNLRQTNVDAATYEQRLKDKDAEHAAEMEALKVDFAGINQMREAGARDPDLAWELAKRRLETAKLSNDGTVDGLQELADSIKAEKAYLFFDADDNQKGLEVAGAEPAHPGNKGGNEASSYETRLAAAKESGDLAAISYVKREAAAKGIILN